MKKGSKLIRIKDRLGATPGILTIRQKWMDNYDDCGVDSVYQTHPKLFHLWCSWQIRMINIFHALNENYMIYQNRQWKIPVYSGCRRPPWCESPTSQLRSWNVWARPICWSWQHGAVIVSGQDVQGVNSATLVVRELATVALKEADTYLPTNLVPLHIIMFEPAGVNKKQFFNWLSWVWAIFKTVY